MDDMKWIFTLLIVGTLCATAVSITGSDNKAKMATECTYLKSDHLITPDMVITFGEQNDTSYIYRK